MFAVMFLSPIRAWAAPILRTDNEGDAVASLQQSLADLGYSPGPVDGDFGPRTDAAVRAFQKSAGLSTDGICGPLTWAALDRNLAESSRGGTVVRGRTLAGKTIVIDPGHGGNEPGAISAWGDKEKDFTLAIGLKVEEYLEAQGAEVVMTRYGDYPPGSDWGWTVDELAARASLANTNRADLFVSIHDNAYPQDASISGVMGFYRRDSAESASLARSLAQGVSKSTGLKMIDVQVGPYYVLNHTEMPAALVEVGFMTNYGDVAALRTFSFVDSAAKGIVSGILDYLSK
ncbi:MAG: N-acetylmuramoyl-L-alanine amidase [Bacillota bacterium]